MSRTLTRLNPNHPHTQLKRFEDVTYRYFQSLSTAKLVEICSHSAIVVSPVWNRKDILAALMDHFVSQWKAEWKVNTGWDFDDSQDPAKLALHIEEARKKREEFAKEGISLKIIYKGAEITREEYASLPPEEQKLVRSNLEERLRAIKDAGFLGLDAKEGLVDRRLFPHATPCEKNELLETPEPAFIP